MSSSVIVHIHGIITPFLEAPQGKPTFNLLKMAKEGLAFELRNALHKAKLREVAVTKENIPMKIDGNQFLVNIEIVPLTDTVDIHYLILFTKTGLPAAEEKTKTTSSRKLVDAQKQNEQLAKELANTREDMRSVTEDMEATNEELQSANEELQSSNEEMQSLNEEMETSKEELQSTNEELNIVNKEMLDKQEQLNAARLYSEAIVTTIRHPLIILDRALRIKTANAAFYKNFGTNEEETEDKLFYEIQTHRWNDQLMRTLLENILPKKETIVDLELIIKFPGLGERHLLMNARQIKNEKTAEHLILLAIEDVTEQVVARKQLEASEKRFSNILEQSIMAISIFKGREMRIAFMNEPMIVMYGKGRDVIGKTLLEVLPEMKDQPFPKLLDDVYTTGVPYYGYEMPGTLVRNGRAEKTYFNFVYQPYREVDNSITGITVIGTEVGVQVHAKKQIEASEAKFRTLSENIPHMIWTATADGKKNFFNQFFLEYTGKNFEELSGGFHKIIFPDDLEKDLQLWHHSLKTGEDFNMEKRIRHHDGTYRWHISHGAAQKDEHGNIMGWIGSNTDIDEQKKFANDLMEAKVFAEMATLIAEDEKAKAEIALQSKQQFLSNMSHEIRTPMNAIIGFTKVLLKTDLTEKQKEYLQAIKSSGNTLIVLINDILDLAKVNAGKMIFVNLPFKISESMTIILNLFEAQIQEKNLEFVKEYDSKIPKILLGDSVRLHQILINLLSNAIKFTSKGKIVVSVNMLNQDEEKVILEIKVTDTGIGIPKNKIDAIFENFEQAHIISSNLYGGTGLGLAIVKQLVEKQGGTISIKSKVGEGSTFSFTLGFQKTNADPDSYRKENEAGQYETEIKPLKVLVVEDVKLNQLLMRTLLDDFKFAWDIADNGKIAIEKLQTSSYDIILMDLQMPVMNGFEATEHIRNKMNLQTPIIALTADVTTVDLEKCKAVGMNDYISKPIDEEQLYSKILELIKF
jgi:PAS domain S-box-containing protein